MTNTKYKIYKPCVRDPLLYNIKNYPNKLKAGRNYYLHLKKNVTICYDIKLTFLKGVNEICILYRKQEGLIFFYYNKEIKISR